MMHPVLYAIIVLLVVVFFATLSYIGYQSLLDHADRRIQTTYYLNDPRFRRGRPSRRCPAGCVRTGDKHDSKSGYACPNGPMCYNCEGKNPGCCCYDSQCANC